MSCINYGHGSEKFKYNTSCKLFSPRLYLSSDEPNQLPFNFVFSPPFSACTTFVSGSLFPFDCELNNVAATDSLSEIAPFSRRPERPDMHPSSRDWRVWQQWNSASCGCILAAAGCTWIGQTFWTGGNHGGCRWGGRRVLCVHAAVGAGLTTWPDLLPPFDIVEIMLHSAHCLFQLDKDVRHLFNHLFSWSLTCTLVPSFFLNKLGRNFKDFCHPTLHHERGWLWPIFGCSISANFWVFYFGQFGVFYFGQFGVFDLGQFWPDGGRSEG